MRFLICTADIDPCPPANITSLAMSEVLDFAALGISPADVFFVFGWGFSMVLFGWVAGYGIGLAIGLIRKL